MSSTASAPSIRPCSETCGCPVSGLSAMSSTASAPSIRPCSAPCGCPVSGLSWIATWCSAYSSTSCAASRCLHWIFGCFCRSPAVPLNPSLRAVELGYAERTRLSEFAGIWSSTCDLRSPIRAESPSALAQRPVASTTKTGGLSSEGRHCWYSLFPWPSPAAITSPAFRSTSSGLRAWRRTRGWESSGKRRTFSTGWRRPRGTSPSAWTTWLRRPGNGPRDRP